MKKKFMKKNLNIAKWLFLIKKNQQYDQMWLNLKWSINYWWRLVSHCTVF